MNRIAVKHISLIVAGALMASAVASCGNAAPVETETAVPESVPSVEASVSESETTEEETVYTGFSVETEPHENPFGDFASDVAYSSLTFNLIFDDGKFGYNCGFDNSYSVYMLQQAVYEETGVLDTSITLSDVNYFQNFQGQNDMFGGGYKFSEAEEKILESGTEAERVKVLTDAIIGNFGDMNQALAGGATGKIKQVENDLGDLKEVTGGLLKPLQQEIMATTMVLSRDFYATLNGIVKIVAPILQRGVEAFRNFYEKASGGFEEVSRKIEAGCQLILNNIEPLAQGIIISVGVVSAALIELGVHFAIVKAQAWAAGHASVIAAIKSAVAWAVAHWQISLIIGVVIGLIALLLRFAGVANVIGAIFGGAFGFIKTVIIDCFAVAWNTIVPIINLMLGIGETIYNAITNPIGALKNFFYTAFDFIGDILQSVFASIPGIGKKLAKDFAANRKHIMEARQEDLEKTGEWRQFKRVNQMGASELISGTIEGAKTGMKVANKLEDVIKGVKLGGDNNNLQDAISAALDDKFSTDGSGSLETKDKTLLDISSDYRELLTQAATRRFNLKFQQVTPNVTISGVQFGANADLDTVIEKFTDKIEEVSNSALAG